MDKLRFTFLVKTLSQFETTNWFFGIILIMVLSCNKHTESNENIIAKAYQQELKVDEIQNAIADNIHGNDSLMFAKNYINNWVLSQIMLESAKKNTQINHVEIERKLAEYERDLLIYHYRNQLIVNQIDSIVKPQDLSKFYQENKENFELKQNIVKLVFIKMPTAYHKKYDTWKKFLIFDDAKINELASMALHNGGNASMDGEHWMLFDDLLKEIPIQSYNQEHFLKNNRIFKIDGEEFCYYVKILDFKIKDNISPIEFVSDQIKSIILNKRKAELMKKVEIELLEKAIKNKDVIIQ